MICNQEVDAYIRQILLSKSSSINSLGFIAITLRRQFERSSDINSKSTNYLNMRLYRSLAIVSY